MVVLLEYNSFATPYKQSTTIIWMGLSPANPTHSYTTVLNIITTIEVLCKELLNSCKQWACPLHISLHCALYMGNSALSSLQARRVSAIWGCLL